MQEDRTDLAPGALVEGSAVKALLALLEIRDAAISQHAARVAELARGLAVAVGCGSEQSRDVYVAGVLHDIGKLAIPDEILRNRCPLSKEEWRIVARHPAAGADVVSHLGGLARLAPIVRGHHERYDGGGYPDGLRGLEIPLEARIISVVDAFDAMTSDRAYQPQMSVGSARARLRECAGTQFDPELVATFDRCLGEVDVSFERSVAGVESLAA